MIAFLIGDHHFRTRHHAGARGLGMLMGASGVGALCGALALAFRKDLRGLGRWITVAAATFGGALIVFSYSIRFNRRSTTRP